MTGPAFGEEALLRLTRAYTRMQHGKLEQVRASPTSRLRALFQTGKSLPSMSTPQKAAYEKLSDKAQDMYVGLRALGMAHAQAHRRALALYGKRTSWMDRHLAS